MNGLTPTEKAFIKKVRAFQSRTGCSFGSIGYSSDVRYSNTKKLEEFFLEERGTISMSLAGRIEIYMKKYDKKVKK